MPNWRSRTAANIISSEGFEIVILGSKASLISSYSSLIPHHKNYEKNDMGKDLWDRLCYQEIVISDRGSLL